MPDQDLSPRRDSDPGCPFCAKGHHGRILAEHESAVAIADRHPVTPGHMLILPRRHVPDVFGLTADEWSDALHLIRTMRDRSLAADETITGFNIGVNCGASAGQTIRHAHIHLIPRRDGDTPRPRGGVRGVIPEKMDY